MRSGWRWAWVVLLAAAVAACDGSGGGGAPPDGTAARDASGDDAAARPDGTVDAADASAFPDAAAGDTPAPADAPGGDADGPPPDGGVPPLYGELPPPDELGGERPARLLLPRDYDATERLPLIVLLGGYSYFAGELDDWIGLSDRVDDAGFALLLPDGTIDSEGWPFWNATDTCCDYDGSGVDDAGYLTRLLDEALERVAIDPARVVFMGHSNPPQRRLVECLSRAACGPDPARSARVVRPCCDTAFEGSPPAWCATIVTGS